MHGARRGVALRRSRRPARRSPDVDASFASPKSRIFARPSAVTKMFSGLRSRWTMPLVVRRGEARRDLHRVLDRLAHRDRRARAARLPHCLLVGSSRSVAPRAAPSRCTARRRACRARRSSRGSGWLSAPAARASCSKRCSRSLLSANAGGSTLIATSRPMPRVARAPDLAHAAGAERRDDLVTADSGARRDGHEARRINRSGPGEY